MQDDSNATPEKQESPEQKAAPAERKPKAAREAKKAPKAKRFNLFHRIAHAVVTLGVIGASITGFPLKFKDVAYMGWLTQKLGGVAQMALYHRIFAVMIGSYIATQVLYMGYYFIALRRGVDVSSLSWVLPRKRETLDVPANAMYLIGRRGEPSFKKQVYWGVFDWIVSIAGIWAIIVSGAMVWWPQIIAQYIPGTWLNVAYVTHSNGAVLLIVIIFITHFYNIYWSTGHLSDCNIILTGRMTTRRKKLT